MGRLLVGVLLVFGWGIDYLCSKTSLSSQCRRRFPIIAVRNLLVYFYSEWMASPDSIRTCFFGISWSRLCDQQFKVNGGISSAVKVTIWPSFKRLIDSPNLRCFSIASAVTLGVCGCTAVFRPISIYSDKHYALRLGAALLK